MADWRIQTECEGCGATLTFPSSELGTVQECSACGGYVDVPEITRRPTVLEEHWDAYDRQMNDADRQTKRYEKQLDHGDEQITRRNKLDDLEEQILIRAERLVERWERLADRLENYFSPKSDGN